MDKNYVEYKFTEIIFKNYITTICKNQEKFKKILVDNYRKIW